MRKKLLTRFLSVAMSVALVMQPSSAFAADSSSNVDETITVADSVTKNKITTLDGDSISDATSISLGTTYSGSITETNEKDYYTFTLSSAGKVTLDANAKMEYITYGLYDNNGNELWESTPLCNSTTEEIAMSEKIDLTKGTYYFAVQKYGSNMGTYSFTLSFSSANESFTEEQGGSDNTLGDANDISLDTSYNAQIALNDDKDFYRFTLSTAGKIVLDANAKMEYITYGLYDNNGNELWESTPLCNSTTEEIATSEKIDLTKGTYYFAVQKYGSNMGTYSFTLSFSSANESFTEEQGGSDNTLGDANDIELNTSYKGQIALNDDKDFYKVTLLSSARVTLSSTAHMEYITYIIYDSNGNELWSSTPLWNSTTEKIEVSHDIELSEGVYYFAVQKYGSNMGAYSFKLSTHTHNYEEEITEATPTSDGKIVRKCSCGATNGSSIIYAPETLKLSSTSYTYNGKTKKPTVKVKDRNGEIISSSNYKVSYSSGRKNVGKYTVKVSFKGKYYSGSMKKTFTIKPKSTSISKLSAKSKAFTVKWKKQTTQVSGYQIQYSTSKSFSNKTTKTISKNTTTSATYKKLKAKKKYYVRIRTYKKVSGKNYYSSWSSIKSVTTKK